MPNDIAIHEIIHSLRRTIALIIRADGTLTIRAPLRMPAGRIQEFVEKHAGWIHKKQAQMKANPPPAVKEYRKGESFLFLGKAYPLILTPHQRPALIFREGKFHLAEVRHQGGKEIFIRWYKERARELISERARTLAGKYGLAYEKIRIGSARTRWGSCSGTGTLSFSWRLVMAPPEVVDYVVIHELMHTKVRNHSTKFWQKVASVMPDYKRQAAWLRKNGRFLTLDGKP